MNLPALKAVPSSTPSALTRVLAAIAARVGVAVVLICIAVLLIFPLVSFLLLALIPGLFGQVGGGVASFGRALSGIALESLRNSLLVSVASGVCASLLGLWLSYLTQRTTLREARAIDALMWVLLLAPSYLISVGWLTLVQRGGVLSGVGWYSQALSDLILGPFGVTLVLTLKHVPFAYLAIAPGWAGIGGELEEAARVHGVRSGRSTRLIAGLLLPAMAAAFAVSFAEGLGDFGVASTLAANANFPVATFNIYRALYSNPLDFGLAAASSWLLLLLSGLALWFQARVARKARAYAALTGRSRPARRVTLTRSGLIGSRLGLVAMALLGLAIPTLGTVSSAFTLKLSDGLAWSNLTFKHFVEAAHVGLLGPFGYSAALALIAATVSVALGLALAGILSRPTPLARGLDLALLGAMALPGLVLAAGYIFAFNQPFAPLYGTSLLLCAAYAAGGMPATSRLLLGPVTQLHRSLSESARVHGLSGSSVLRCITAPLLSVPLFSAWLLSSTHVMFELPMSELLYPPGQPPLPVALVSYVNNFEYSLGAALEIEAVALVLLAVWLARVVFARLTPLAWRRGAVSHQSNSSHGASPATKTTTSSQQRSA